MARKRLFFNGLKTLPWWFSLLLAAVAYVGLKYFLPGIEFKSPLLKGLGPAFSTMASFFVFIFIFTAALSAYHAWRKGELFDGQTSVKSIKELSWKDFEYLVGEAYRRKGYSVVENTGSGADGGIDLVLSKNGEKTLVQCKNWKSRSVGVKTIRELYGVVMAEGASEGVVVCSGYFTSDAIDFAAGKPLTLIDGSELSQFVGGLQKTQLIKPKMSQAECPVCHNSMVLRTARRGKNNGRSFWGCSRFPKCRGTREV